MDRPGKKQGDKAAVNDAEARLSRIETRIAFRMREGQPV
jgi:hypothetical protein